MITFLEELPDHVIGVEITEKLRGEDFAEQLVPRVNERLTEHDKLDLLLHFQGSWQGMDAGAAWQDMRLALGKLGHWARMAVVSDIGWMATSLKMLRPFWPGEVRHFRSYQIEDARAWVCETERAHVRCSMDSEAGILSVESDADSSLSEDDFEAVGQHIEQWLKDHEQLEGVLLHSRRFPGWGNLGALFAHLKFAHHVHDKIQRIALVTNSPVGSLADHVLDPLTVAKIRRFDFDQLEQAQDWLAQDRS